MESPQHRDHQRQDRFRQLRSGCNARWRALPVWARATLAAVTVLGLLNAGAAMVEFVTGGSQPGGPASSSYATAGSGSAAYAALLANAGHPVTRLRRPLDMAPPGLEQATLVLLDPNGVSERDAHTLRKILQRGGRVVTGDFGGDERLLRALFEDRPVWGLQAGHTALAVVPTPETRGVERVRSDEGAVWRRAGQTVPIIANNHGAFAVVATVGRGTVVLLADTTPISNKLLARDSNAAFGIAIAGESGRPVVFDEAVHGYGEATGLQALPARWKLALSGVLAATLVWMIASGRRFGPAERAARDLPPPRRAYVEALAATLARTRRPAEAMAPARDAARIALAKRAGINPDSGADVLHAAAIAIGLPDDEATAIAHGSDDPLVTARALVHVTGARR